MYVQGRIKGVAWGPQPPFFFLHFRKKKLTNRLLTGIIHLVWWCVCACVWRGGGLHSAAIS